MLLFKEMNVSNQKELIEKTVRDYIEGFYGMDPERMRHALHPKLVKRRPNQENLETGFDELTAEQLAEAAGNPAIPRKPGELNIHILDIFKDMAAVRADSPDYIDYIQLVQTRDGWKIVNVLWQFI